MFYRHSRSNSRPIVANVDKYILVLNNMNFMVNGHIKILEYVKMGVGLAASPPFLLCRIDETHSLLNEELNKLRSYSRKSLSKSAQGCTHLVKVG